MARAAKGVSVSAGREKRISTVLLETGFTMRSTSGVRHGMGRDPCRGAGVAKVQPHPRVPLGVEQGPAETPGPPTAYVPLGVPGSRQVNKQITNGTD